MTLELIEQPARQEYLDIARGLGMVLVLYGHILQILFHKRLDGGFSEIAFAQWQAIYSFHMPLFFMISGALVNQFTNKSWKQVLSKSLYFILLAYLVDVLGSLVMSWTTEVPLSSIFNRDYWVKHILLADVFSTITLWFLVAFALIRLAAYALLRYAGLMRWLLIGVLLLVFALAYSWPNAFHIRAVVPGLIFFMLGRLLVRHGIKISPMLGLLLLASALWTAHYNAGCTFSWQQNCENAELPGYFAVLMIFGLYGQLGWFFFSAITGSLAILSLASWLVQTRLALIFCYLGRHSLDLLILNGFCLVLINPVLRDKVAIDESIGFYIALGVITILAHILVLFITKPLLALIHRIVEGLAGCLVMLLCRPLIYLQSR